MNNNLKTRAEILFKKEENVTYLEIGVAGGVTARVEYKDGVFLINSSNGLSAEKFFADNTAVLNDVMYYTAYDVITDYIKDGDVSALLFKLKFVVRLLKRYGDLTNDEYVLFMKNIFINYKYFLSKEARESYTSDVKFFASNIVPEFIENINIKYEKSNISEFVDFILTSVNDISYQSKVIDGLLNYNSKNPSKIFSIDISKNLDFEKISIENMARLYAIISRQNANKEAMNIIKVINERYVSKLSNDNINKFTEYFCRDVNNINYFKEKSSINIANYSQTMISYFEYISKTKDFECLDYSMKSLRENIPDTVFGTLKKAMVEQITKSIGNNKQRENINKLLINEGKNYANDILYNVAGSIFYDGISHKESIKLLAVDNSEIFNKAVSDGTKHNFSIDRKNRILLNNKECLLELSKIKTFKEEFLNEEVIVYFLKNNKNSDSDKRFLLNFYKDVILMNPNSLSKISPIAYIQKGLRKAKVVKFEKVLCRNGISENNFTIEGNWDSSTDAKIDHLDTNANKHSERILSTTSRGVINQL